MVHEFAIVGPAGEVPAKHPNMCSASVYPRFREQGYDCGSGPTESQCGTLTSRVKGAGMRWDGDNGESMMALAAIDHSRQWRIYWQHQRDA